ncbi:hypothetical protein KP509_16G018400 [Ceratopteris richardii]|uniref:DUF7074 domain-containing protein n=1 Tax=Ceratopteris richardii TaxID=49495 RepID=A0A8T2SZ21_CERRI|nr:hypothetical protein KP509_16G018400 [Ceratopteris richardii]
MLCSACLCLGSSSSLSSLSVTSPPIPGLNLVKPSPNLSLMLSCRTPPSKLMSRFSAQTTSVFNTIQGDEKTADAPICSSQDTPIHCSDPAVLNAIINYNLEHFPDLSFFSYYPAVKGPSDDQCDAAWKFRAKKEKSWRMYKDFRRFTLTVSEACNVSVVDTGGWHFGKYAKHLIPRKRGSPHGSEDDSTYSHYGSP